MGAKHRVLVLGSEGMLGRVLLAWLKGSTEIQVIGTVSKTADPDQLFFRVPENEELLHRQTEHWDQFGFVVNCIGVLNRQIQPSDPDSVARAKHVNSWFPKALASRIALFHSTPRLLHISTDAVFSPLRGPVHELDPPDAVEPYGLSKLQGEISAPHTLNLRLSIIGFNPSKKAGLIEYSLSQWQQGLTCQGSSDQLWAGATVLQVAQLCQRLITQKNLFETFRGLTPTLHFAPNRPINRLELLDLLSTKLTHSSGRTENCSAPPQTRTLTNLPQIAAHLPQPIQDWPEIIQELTDFERFLTR